MKTEIGNLTDEVICPCSGTTRAKIQQLYEQGMDIESISRWTGAISGCGGCEWDIAQLINLLTEMKTTKNPH